MGLLDWEDLPHRLERTRPLLVENREGIKVRVPGRDQEPKQVIWALIQPKTGKLDAKAEGVLASANFVAFTQITVSPDCDERVDVKEGENLKDSVTGKVYRVVFASNEGGQDDHLLIYLFYQSTGT